MPRLLLVPGLSTALSPLKTTPTEQEKQLNHFFRTRLTLNSADEFNQELWDVHIPLASQSQPTVWHASNALAALFSYQLSKSNPDTALTRRMYEESLRQYSSALNCVIQLTRKTELSAAEKSSILVANILFLRCCLCRGDFPSAMIVIANSIKLTKHWKYWEYDSSPTPIPPNLVILFFTKIEPVMHESLLTTGPALWQWKAALSSLQTQPFTSSEDACLELEMLWTGMRAVVDKLPVFPKPKQLEEAAASRTRFRQDFESWECRFETLQLLAGLAKTNRGRFMILHVRKILVNILTRVDLSQLETSWDEFNHLFERATLLAESVLRERQADSKIPAFAPMLTKSLHFMAKVCREPKLRRRIIAALRPQLCMVRLISQKEDYAPTQIVDTIMAVEESGWALAKDGRSECNCLLACVPDIFICRNHRVVEVNASARSGRATELCLRTRGDVANKRPGHILFITAPILVQ